MFMQKYITRIFIIFLPVTIAPFGRAEAHNGRVGIAVPIDGIEIDGDLSDWPEDVKSYSIVLTGSGESPREAADFRGGFKVAYAADTGMLYLGVSVQDESVVLEQDGCEVYVDLLHGDKESPARVYSIYGGERRKQGPRGERLAWEGVELGVQRVDEQHSYEWAIDLRGWSDRPVRVNSNMTIGLDVAVLDGDADGSSSWMTWGKGTRKRQLAQRRGDLIFVAAGAATGLFQGRVGGDGEKAQLGKIRSTVAEGLWVLNGRE